jgi:hypothetical protein
MDAGRIQTALRHCRLHDTKSSRAWSLRFTMVRDCSAARARSATCTQFIGVSISHEISARLSAVRSGSGSLTISCKVPGFHSNVFFRILALKRRLGRRREDETHPPSRRPVPSSAQQRPDQTARQRLHFIQNHNRPGNIVDTAQVLRPVGEEALEEANRSGYNQWGVPVLGLHPVAGSFENPAHPLLLRRRYSALVLVPPERPGWFSS